MKRLMILLILCHVASAVKHSMKFYLMVCSGVPDFPDYTIIADLDEVRMAYFDSNMKAPEARHDWVRKLIEQDPDHWKRNALNSMLYEQLLKRETESFKQNLSQSAGFHVTQQILGCEWDDESENVNGSKQYGLNGEDFLAFDLETETWIAANRQAELTKQEWDKDTTNNEFWKTFLTDICPAWLKMYLKYANKYMQITVPPSVSLLQKTPSSPVSCHATGFYPDRAEMFWRKDGEQLHEDVDRGEILHNHDGTFQMNVDLNVSSVQPEDWRRYDCVFQLSGVKEDIITNLDKSVIRTNWVPPSEFPVSLVVAVGVLLLLVVCAAGLFIWRRKKNSEGDSSASEGTSMEKEFADFSSVLLGTDG